MRKTKIVCTIGPASESPEKIKVKVNIFEQEYTIIGDKSPDYINKVASEVDEMMRKVHKKNPQMPLGKVAVLAALNLADELTKTKEDYKWLLEIIEDEKKK